MFKLEQGDYLEKHYSSIIRELIPNYEKIWSTFIGHDGNGRMIHIPNMNTEDTEIRVELSEHLYTSVESIICMHNIKLSVQSLEFKTPDDYINALNLFMAFHGHSGRIRDNSEKMLSLFYKKGVNKQLLKLEDLFAKRNNVVHGKKLPVRILNYKLHIATPMGSDQSLGSWNSSMNWSDFDDNDFKSVIEYLDKTICEMSKIFDGYLYHIYKPMMNLFEKYNIKSISDIKLDSNVEISKAIGAQGPISSSFSKF